MAITLCGSLSFYEKGAKVKHELEELRFDVLWPWGMEELHSGRLTLGELSGFKVKNQSDAIRKHWEKIKQGDAVLVINEEKNGIPGYIGGNTLMEMGFAYVLDKPIYLLNPLPQKSSYMDELLAMEPVVLNGDLNLIKKQ